MRMKMFTGSVVFIPILMSLSAISRADNIAPCSPPDSDVKVLSFPGSVPAIVLKALTEHVGDIVAPGVMFDSTDVIRTGHNRRAIFVWNRGERYVIATERGGIGYNDPVFVYEVDPRAHSAKLVSEEVAFPDTVCEVAKSLMSDR
jgi:hypothetical protein